MVHHIPSLITDKPVEFIDHMEFSQEARSDFDCQCHAVRCREMSQSDTDENSERHPNSHHSADRLTALVAADQIV